MPAPANELQKLIFETLTGDASLGTLVSGRVFDRVPLESDEQPSITFSNSTRILDESNCIPGTEHRLQIDVWSEKQGGYKECNEIVWAIFNALHEQDLELETHALHSIRVVAEQVLRDPDGMTSHGIVEVEARIEHV